jgi:hypothetical protein
MGNLFIKKYCNLIIWLNLFIKKYCNLIIWFIFLQNIPKFISWLKYLSYQYYGFNLLMKIEYTPDMVYDCSPHGCDTLGKSPVLHGLNLDGGSTEALSLFAMSIGYRFLAYLVLRFQKPSPPN